MAVEINVDLDSVAAHGKIEALETHLKTLNDDLDLDFDLDDDLKDNIQKMAKELSEINIDVDYKDLEKAAALKAYLAGDIETDLNVNTERALRKIREDLDPPGIDHDGQAKKFGNLRSDEARFNDFFARFQRMFGQPRGPDGTFKSTDYRRRLIERHRIGDPMGTRSYDRDRLNRMANLIQNRRTWGPNSDRDFNIELGNLPTLGGRDGGGRRRFKFGDGGFTSFGDGLKSFIPRMSTFYNLLAALIPILVVAATQAIGVAAAMGSVAVAGGSILALGLVGHGEDMASSWEEAQKQLADLKKELFETFQPTMQSFAPIQERFFDMAPEELNKVARAMEGLTVYSDTLFAAFSGITDFIAEFFNLLVNNEGAISELAMRFGDIIGSNILGFFRWLIQETYESQGMLIRLGQAFKNLMMAIYPLLKVLVLALTTFTPLTYILRVMGELLENKVVLWLVTFGLTLASTIKVVTMMTSAVTFLTAIMNAGLLATLRSNYRLLAGYIFRTITAATANYALAASIANVVAFATLGIGALLGLAAASKAVSNMDSGFGIDHNFNGGAGSGFSSGGGYGGGGAGSQTTQTIINEGDTYNLEVNGDVDNPTEQGLRDIVQSENGVNASRQTPQPGN